MKDIYELFNDADIDFSNVEEMNINELDRKRGKKKLMDTIKKKKSKKKGIAIAAASVAIICCTSMVYINPALAEDIPIIGGLIQEKLININSDYENYINVIGQTKSYDGIDVTFENAVADKNALFVSVVIKDNNKPIDDEFIDRVGFMSLKVNGKEINTSGSSTNEIIDENTIRILRKVDWNLDKLSSMLKIDMGMHSITNSSKDSGIKFSMNTKDIEKNTYTQKVGKILDIDGRECKVEEIITSPLTTSIKYYVKGKEEDPTVDFLVLDQDGNEVKFDSGCSTTEGSKGFVKGRIDYLFNYINTKNPSKLTLIPKVGSTNNYNDKNILDVKSINVNEFKPFTFKVSDSINIDVENIEVEDNKLILQYNYKYNGKKIVKPGRNDIFVQGNGVYEVSELDEKYRCDDTNTRVFNIGSNNEIEVGCYDIASRHLLEDEKFTIEIK